MRFYYFCVTWHVWYNPKFINHSTQWVSKAAELGILACDVHLRPLRGIWNVSRHELGEWRMMCTLHYPNSRQQPRPFSRSVLLTSNHLHRHFVDKKALSCRVWYIRSFDLGWTTLILVGRLARRDTQFARQSIGILIASPHSGEVARRSRKCSSTVFSIKEIKRTPIDVSFE